MVDDPIPEDDPARVLTRRQGRRRFIAGVLAGAGATSIPHWLSHSFGIGTHALHPHGLGEVLDGGAAPQRLLVLVIPADLRSRWSRGYAFGAWLNHGTAEQLSWLAYVDVCCELVDDLPALGVEVEGEPWMVLVEPELGRATPIMPAKQETEIVAAELPADPITGEERDVEGLTEALAEIAGLASGLGGIIEAHLSRWADEERAALSCFDIDSFEERVEHGGWPWPKLVQEAPAALMLAARDEDTNLSPTSVTEAFAERVRSQYVLREVPGSRWARGSGCGWQIEGEAPNYFGCGMGHVPQLSRRFLWLFADDEM